MCGIPIYLFLYLFVTQLSITRSLIFIYIEIGSLITYITVLYNQDCFYFNLEHVSSIKLYADRQLILIFCQLADDEHTV